VPLFLCNKEVIAVKNFAAPIWHLALVSDGSGSDKDCRTVAGFTNQYGNFFISASSGFVM